MSTSTISTDAHIVRKRTIVPSKSHALAELIDIVSSVSLAGAPSQIVINLSSGGTIANIQIIEQARLRTLAEPL